MIKTYEFKLYNSPKNKILHNLISRAALVYNYCIEEHRNHYKLYGTRLDKYTLQRKLTRLKNTEEYAFLKTIGSQAIQDITDRIDRSYTLFFKNIVARKNNTTKRRVSPPSFKKSTKYKSITLKQAGYKLLGDNRIRIGKEVYKFSKSRELEGEIKTLTIKRNALGELFLFVCCEVPDPQPTRTMTGKKAGFDFGLKTFLTSSDEADIHAPLFYTQSQKAIKQANNNLSRKKKGSGQHRAARMHLARVHKKIANQRKDYQFKLARTLTAKYDLLCFEDLHMDAMKKLWGKKVSDLGFSNFMRILQYVASLAGSKIQIIDRFYPSSKQCHCCFSIKEDLSLKDRVWQCSNCQVIHQRDKNAAINIYREGASSLGLGKIRPSSMAISA